VLPGYSVRTWKPLGPLVSLHLPYDLHALSTSLTYLRAISENPSRCTSVSSTSSSPKEQSIDTSGSEISHATAPKAQTIWTPKRLVLLPFSANDDKALQSSIQSLSSVADDYEISQLSHTLASRRSRFSQRAFVVAPSNAVSRSLQSINVISIKSQRESKSRIGYIFTGQGAQWPSMGRELFIEYKTFRESICYQDQVLAMLSKRPPWRIEDILTNDKVSHMMHEPVVSQTVCTALQIALVELLSSWGISPSATVGHSSGEIAACYAAGRLTAAEAIVIAWFRGYTVSKNERKGTMLAVGLGLIDIKPYLTNLEADIRIAASNSPKSVTLSGETAAIHLVAAQLEEEGIFNRVLKTGGNAYHSHHMQVLGSLYEHDAKKGLEEIADLVEPRSEKSHTLWVSSVTPERSTTDINVGPSYWRQNLESPVLFDSAVEQLLQQSAEDIEIFLEIGPHPALAGPIKQIMQVVKASGSKIPTYIGSLVRGKDDLQSILELGGNLFVQNASINIDALNGFQNLVRNTQLPPVCVDLPNYKYNYGPILFHENRLNKEWRLRKHLRHDLLGSRQLGGTSICPSWRNMFRLKDVPWLGDHRLVPQAIFPAAGFLAMAVEAAAQCHTEVANAPVIAGYSFRNVRVWSTLEVPDTEVGTDVVTNVQKTAATSWYEFKISSLNDKTDAWIEHCTGLVRIEITDNEQRQTVADGEQNWCSMNMKEWYTKFAEMGLEYGPSFQGLSNLKYARGCAAANVELAPTKDAGIIVESTYTLHPAALDNLLQLANIAAYSGNVKLAKQAYIPVMFDDLTIWNRQDVGQSGVGYAVAEGERRGSRGMYSSIQLFAPTGEVLVDMNYFKGISYDGVSLSSKDEAERPQDPFTMLIWKPDITKLSNANARDLFPISDSGSLNEREQLLEKFDKLTAYLVVTISVQFQETSFSGEQAHLKRFMDWIHRGHMKIANGEMRFGIEAVTATPQKRSDVVEALFNDLSNLVETKLIRRIFENISAIFSGQTTGLEIALGDNLLVDLYTLGRGVCSAYPRVQDMVDLLAHKNPRMKILEIGAGTGGATSHILDTLEAESPFKRYQEYTFTDLTPYFLSAAQDKFAASRGINYSILDIEFDPLEQGFSAGEYDLIVASQVLHATSSLARTLQNVRRLLKPGGKLLLLEFTKVHPVSTFVLGTFPYYWNGVTDGRVNGPLAGRDRWNTELVHSGFSGIDIILGDNDTDLESASIILATAVEQRSVPSQLTTKNSTEPGVFVLTLGEPTDFARSVAEELRLTGHEQPCLVTAVDCKLPEGSRLISLIDIEKVAAMFDNEALYNNLKRVLTSASSILWVSSGNVIQSSNPATGLMVGLLKTVAREMPHLRLAQLSFDSKFDGSLEFTRQVVASEGKLCLGKENLTQTDDIEIFQNGCVHISRLAPNGKLNTRYKIQEGLDTEARMERLGTLGPVKVTTARPGILSTLQFEVDADMLGPLPDDWVEIKSEAIDVNVKDIAVTTGRFDLNTYSTACCGIVSRLGSGVKHIQLGDRVCGFAPGNFGNFVRVPAIYQQRMELTDKPTDLASLPISYMTALYAMKNLAHIEKGESVLIQSATGALGLATLRIARHLGADIYVTVGNSDKAELLEREFGIPRDRIFSSRELDTPKKIWSASGNRGIDVILCSTTAGEQMEDIWRCIAPLGRFIEVGRLNVINHGKLPMEVFKRNATFSSFDISLVSKQKPQLGAA
jgi:acyl transferase domain-containing protein/NADPH:quinone reductase-like Zn-dependent oxidoreductase